MKSDTRKEALKDTDALGPTRRNDGDKPGSIHEGAG